MRTPSRSLFALIALAALTLAPSSVAGAQAAPADSTPPVVVASVRQPVKSMNVVTAAELTATSAATLEDALREVRPSFLTDRSGQPIEVVLDGSVLYDGASRMRSIPTNLVASVTRETGAGSGSISGRSGAARLVIRTRTQ